MSRECQITGKKYNSANSVSHSNHKTKYKQQPNLQTKKFFIPELNKCVTLRVSTTAIKTITKYGMLSTLKRYNVNRDILK